MLRRRRRLMLLLRLRISQFLAFPVLFPLLSLALLLVAAWCILLPCCCKTMRDLSP